MAEILRYLDPTSSGGDGTTAATSGANAAYASLSAWNAAEFTDLVVDDDTHKLSIAPGLDTVNFTLEGWTTDPTHFITLEAQSAARHNGVSRDVSGTGYQYSSTQNYAFRCKTSHVHIVGLEFKGTAFSIVRLSGTPLANSDIHFEDILINHKAAIGEYGLEAQAAYNLRCDNVLIIGDGRGFNTISCNSAVIDHCGIDTVGTLGFVNGTETTVTNTWSINHTTEDFDTSPGGPGSNNASEDTSATTTYTSSLSSINPVNEFTAPATGDYTLKTGNSLAGAGIGSLANDIADTAYPSPSDIGIFSDDVAGGPSITSITDPAITGVALTITGTAFEAVQGTGGVTQEQGAVIVGLTETAWSDTSITATSAVIEVTGLKYGSNTIKVTVDAGGNDTTTFVANPVADNSYIDLTSIATAGDRITAIADLAIGDQIRYEALLQLEGVPTVYTVAVNADATFSVDGSTLDGIYTFNIRAWDTSDQTWGTAADQTVVIGTPAPPAGGMQRDKAINLSIDISL